MGGGSGPKEPTLDVGASAALYERQLQLQNQYLPQTTRTAGAASRDQYQENINFGLGMLADTSLRRRYELALPEEIRRRNELLSSLEESIVSGAEYNRLQREMQGAVGERAGMLTPEQQREAVQSARSAMAARGMATGSAGAAAEILNRDRFMQDRRAQDLNILGQSVQLANQERARQLATRQDAYNFGLSTNPNMMAIGLGSPYANLTPNAMQMVGNTQGLQPMYSGGSFSSGGGMGKWGGAAAGALSGAASGALLGAAAGGIGAIPGAIIGGVAGGAAGYFSDERMKKDIKPLGKAGNVLGLTAYEFNYKDDAKNTPKRVGFMAQDVQKVLPEAVEEVNYKGKKRLAIKPDVIGAALAQEITEQSKAVAA